MRKLRGKRALITGAASGIGRAIALALADDGAQLELLDVNVDGLAETAALAAQRGSTATCIPCDLSQPEQISRAIQSLLARDNRLDILVNNAGVAYYGPTKKMSAEQWQWLLSINLLAPIQITRELLPTLLARPEAHVLNVCSIAGLVAGGRSAAYHTSKFGLIGFTESLRAEFGRRGLGVSAICPGPVLTNLYSSALSGRSGKPVPTPPAWLCSSVETIARRAVTAVRRNRRCVVIGPLAHLLWWTKTLAPWLLDWMNHFRLNRRTPTGHMTGSEQRRAA